MSETIALFLEETITKKQLTELVSTMQNVVVIPNPQDVGFYFQVSRNEAYIWIGISDEPFPDDELQRVVHILGQLWQSIVIVEISNRDGSLDLACEFVDAMANRWRIAVNSLRRWIGLPTDFISIVKSTGLLPKDVYIRNRRMRK